MRKPLSPLVPTPASLFPKTIDLRGIIIMVGFGAAIAYPRLQYSALRQMRGVWLVLSLVPLAVMLVVGVVTALALSEGANLWPLLLIFTAPVATAYLAVLRFVERRVTRPDSFPR